MLSGRGLRDKLITRPEESYRLCCVIVCDLETSKIGAPYIYDISNLKAKRVLGSVKLSETRGGSSYLKRLGTTALYYG